MIVLELEELVGSTLDAAVTFEMAFGPDEAAHDGELGRFLAEAPRTWRELLTFLRDPRSGNGTQLWRLAARAHDRHVLVELAKDGDRFVRRNVAANGFTPAGLLWDLASDEESIVREGVAKNQAADGKLLASMASDSDDFVRAAVRDNVNTPAEIKALLSRRSHS